MGNKEGFFLGGQSKTRWIESWKEGLGIILLCPHWLSSSIRGLALSFCLSTASGSSTVMSNQCWFGASVEGQDPHDYYLLPLMRWPQVVTTTIYHKSGTDVLFLKKECPASSNITHSFLRFKRAYSVPAESLGSSTRFPIGALMNTICFTDGVCGLYVFLFIFWIHHTELGKNVMENSHSSNISLWWHLQDMVWLNVWGWRMLSVELVDWRPRVRAKSSFMDGAQQDI